MGRIYLDYIEGNNIYICKICNTHLTSYNELISKAFKGQSGKAYLFNLVINIKCGNPEEQALLTGKHLISEISCKKCNTVLGWKYCKAYEETQKYKEGKIILEKEQLSKQLWTY